MGAISFELLATDGEARVGRLVTPHGSIETPAFVAVGTQATVRGVSAEDLRKTGTQVIIANTFHLHLRPGVDLIERVGGLHRFMGWAGPLMTDSGGFQIFSLGAGKEHGVGKIAPIFPEEQNRAGHFSTKKRRPLVRVDEEGVEFVSYLDGSRHRFTPEGVIESQQMLGADMILVLDECTSPLHDYHHTRAAMQRTHRWALQAQKRFERDSKKRQALFGIVQGGAYQDLRAESAKFLTRQDFDGYAIGGSLGRSKEDIPRVLEWTIPFLPRDKPRHLLGIGTVEDVFEVVRRGIDLFDCIAPTRLAQTGTLFATGVKQSRIHILNSEFKDDPRPIEEGCRCYTCCNYSRAYLRHLFLSRELLAARLATLHNLSFLEALMGQVRSAIRNGQFGALTRA